MQPKKQRRTTCGAGCDPTAQILFACSSVQTPCGERPTFTLDSRAVSDVLYRVEEHRGYDHLGTLWSPGYFRADLKPGHEATLVASTENWDTIHRRAMRS